MEEVNLRDRSGSRDEDEEERVWGRNGSGTLTDVFGCILSVRIHAVEAPQRLQSEWSKS